MILSEPTPLQRFFLARLERLLALPATCPEPAASSPPDLVARAVLSTFHDCIEAGVGLEASLRLYAWLHARGLHGHAFSGGER